MAAVVRRAGAGVADGELRVRVLQARDEAAALRPALVRITAVYTEAVGKAAMLPADDLGFEGFCVALNAYFEDSGLNVLGAVLDDLDGVIWKALS